MIPFSSLSMHSLTLQQVNYQLIKNKYECVPVSGLKQSRVTLFEQHLSNES